MAYVAVASVKNAKSGLQASKASSLLHGQCSHTLTLYLTLCLVQAKSFSKYSCFFVEERGIFDDSSNLRPNVDASLVFRSDRVRSNFTKFFR